MSAQTVAVFGASGNVGSVLTEKLADRGAQVRVFYHPSTPPRAPFPDGAIEFADSFDDPQAIARAMHGADAAFLLTPPSDAQPRWQHSLVDAAVSAGVPRRSSSPRLRARPTRRYRWAAGITRASSPSRSRVSST